MQAGISLDRDSAAQAALVVHLLDAAGDFVAALETTMQSDDPHGPHQARVALRRLRSLLAAYGPILDAGFVRGLEEEARQLFRHLGRIRDADVILAATDAEPERNRRLAAARKARRTVRKHLARGKAGGFAGRLEKRLAKKGWKAPGKSARRLRKAPLAVLAAHALDRAAREIQPDMALDRMDNRQLHDLRKEVKVNRYLTETFGPVLQREGWDASLEALKELQDRMGQLSDMALAQRQDDTTVRAALIAASQQLLDRVNAAGPWWRD